MSPHLRTRRQFIRTSVLGGAISWTLPAFLDSTFGVLDSMAADSATQIATGKDNPILVVLQLAGGNDGLNTVIPYADSAYYSSRPKIGVAAKEVLRVNDHLGLHPGLKGFQSLVNDGNLSVIQGVGYPNPNRSHFRATEIWQTASESEQALSTGWLGRYFDNACPGEDAACGISISGETPQSFAGKTGKGISFSDAQDYQFKGDLSGKNENFFEMANSAEDEGGSIGMLNNSSANMMSASESPVSFLRRTSLDARVNTDRIQEILKRSRADAKYPNGRLANNLRTVAQLIQGGMSTRVYYVSQGGFDTHNNQTGAHANLMREMDEALYAFVQDLKAQGNFDRVLLLTFSEFGRRVTENASGGTDHGAAAPMFLIGPTIKPGVIGAHPSLTDLYRGDLKHHTDFRSVYASVLENWLKIPSQPVLGKKFTPTPIFV